MGLFSKTKTYVGVDVGTASIKLVQLTHDGKNIKLDTFGYVDVANDIIHDNTPESKTKLISVLKSLLAKAGVTSKQAIAALPTFAVFTSIINLPKLPGKELTSAINWEAKKYIPLPLEEMVLDWKMVDNDLAEEKKKDDGWQLFKKKEENADSITSEQPEVKDKIISKQQDYIKVLITAAPKSLVNKYVEVFQGAGLNLVSLETEAFALSRSLLPQDGQLAMIVDIGSITTDICVIANRIPVLNRSIDVGGLTITKAIAASLNVSQERAEQFKRDFGLVLGEAQRGIPKTIEASLGPIINEIKYVFDMYRSQSARGIEKILLAGGSSELPNLTDYFGNLFKVPIYIGNPWVDLQYADELQPMLDQIGTRMAVAIGLARRDL
ncbi:MAG: pilus assembly protein PilM [Candidatus Komeilibacteria bacterium]